MAGKVGGDADRPETERDDVKALNRRRPHPNVGIRRRKHPRVNCSSAQAFGDHVAKSGVHLFQTYRLRSA